MFFKDNLADLISKPVEAKTDYGDLQHLADWIEKQDQSQTYCYLDHGRCLLSQYAEAYGRRYVVSFMSFDAANTPEHRECIAAITPHTFAAALERTREGIRALSPIKTEG